MKAFIFAAGLGSRLGRITKETPKELVEVNGKSMLQRTVEKCTESGFDDIIINVHHHPDKMFSEIEKLQKKGYQLTISDETDTLLDTAGGLFKARNFFSDEPFLAINVDIVSNINLCNLYDAALKNKSAIATLFVKERPATRVFLINENGYIKGWTNRETKELLISDSRLSREELYEIPYGCIQIINPEIFEYMCNGKLSLTPFYLDLISKGKDIQTYRYDDCYWFDIGTPQMLNQANTFLRLTERFAE